MIFGYCSYLYFRADITKVEYLINQSTEINDEGFYICNVTSASGFDIGEINVDVLGKFKIRQKRFYLNLKKNSCTTKCSNCTIKIIIYIN